jgi:hypothetical protein
VPLPLQVLIATRLPITFTFGKTATAAVDPVNFQKVHRFALDVSCSGKSPSFTLAPTRWSFLVISSLLLKATFIPDGSEFSIVGPHAWTGTLSLDGTPVRMRRHDFQVVSN